MVRWFVVWLLAGHGAPPRRGAVGVSQGGDFCASHWMLNRQSRLEAECILLLGASRRSNHNRGSRLDRAVVSRARQIGIRRLRIVACAV
jgi:hypothetical protein